MAKRILVMGGTGAMGVYLVPELLQKGWSVDVVALDAPASNHKNLRYIPCKNALDLTFMTQLLTENHYDGMVDFLIYPGSLFQERIRLFLEHVGHYIYLSTYRIYGNAEHPIDEKSPRLLDLPMADEEFKRSDDYALYKARGEDALRASNYANWTAIRPAITYSKRRFQLVTLEADLVVARAKRHLPVLLPEGAKDIQGTMSWAGDVAKMIASLVCNPKAMREIYTVATAEHHTWREIAEYYRELMGLEAIWIPNEDYMRIIAGGNPPTAVRAQLEYDRLFDRIMDNRKILAIANLKQEALMPLKEGLRHELAGLPADEPKLNQAVSDRMDAYLAAHPELK